MLQNDENSGRYAHFAIVAIFPSTIAFNASNSAFSLRLWGSSLCFLALKLYKMILKAFISQDYKLLAKIEDFNTRKTNKIEKH